MAKQWKLLILSIAMCLTVSPAFTQEEESAPEFGLDLGLGAATYNELSDDRLTTEQVTYQSLSLSPDFAIGPFGIGVAITLNYRFTGGDGSEFELRSADWIPSEEVSFLELYLPLFRYIRWGQRGEPLYIKLGSIDDATLGNGFIMGNYSNTHFLPDTRIFGLMFDLDGQLFNFPLVGLQSFVGNLATFDVMGARLYTRPLVFLQVPIIQFLEVGASIVADRDPYAFVEATESNPISVWGIDFKLPILSNPIISLVAFGDFVSQNEHTGGMIGFAGKLFSFLPYGAQLRILGDDFIPVYFGEPYDLFRAQYYAIATNPTTSEPIIDSTAGWFANTGLSILDGLISFSISFDGPFVKPARDILDTDDDAWVNYPHLRGSFVLAEGLVPGLWLNASLDKRNIQTFADLIDFSDAVIGLTINYKTGPAVLTLAYDVRFNPVTEEWETSAKLQSSLSLF